MVEEIRELYEFNRWANRRVLGAAGALSTEQFTRDLGNSFPSVRDTLVHALGAEWIWLSRWNGTSPAALPSAWDFPTHRAVVTRWDSVHEDLTTFLAELTPERLAAPVSYSNTQGQTFSTPLWRLMRHVVNHGSYHRGQVITLLRQLGAEGVATDMVLYYLERSGQIEKSP